MVNFNLARQPKSTNPTADLPLTLTLTLTRTPTLRGAQGRPAQPRGSAAYFGGIFPKPPRAAERPASTNKTRILYEIWFQALLHIGRIQS